MRSSRGSLSSSLVAKYVEVGVQSCRPLSSGHRFFSCASSKVLSRISGFRDRCGLKSGELRRFDFIVGRL